MKRRLRGMTKALSLVLSMAMLSGCNLIAVDPVKEGQEVVAKVGDLAVTRSEFMDTYSMYAPYYGVTLSDTSEENEQLKNTILDQLVSLKVRQIQAKAMGLTDFTDADRAEAEKRVNEFLKEAYDSNLEYFKQQQVTDASIDPEKKAMEAQESSLKSVPMEKRIENELEILADERMVAEICADIQVTDEQVKAEYDTRLRETGDAYKADPTKYPNDYMSQNSTNPPKKPLYVPAGYVYVKHILIKFSDDLANEIVQYRGSAGEDPNSEDAKTADEKLAAALATIQQKAEDVLSKAKADPANFDALVEEYGQDPGMQSEPTKSKGYAVGKDSGMMKSFEEASLALTQDGQISELVPTDYGYHIIQRIGASVETVRPFEDMKDELKEEMLTTQKDTRMEEKLKEWTEATKITKYMERLK